MTLPHKDMELAAHLALCVAVSSYVKKASEPEFGWSLSLAIIKGSKEESASLQQCHRLRLK